MVNVWLCGACEGRNPEPFGRCLQCGAPRQPILIHCRPEDFPPFEPDPGMRWDVP